MTSSQLHPPRNGNKDYFWCKFDCRKLEQVTDIPRDHMQSSSTTLIIESLSVLAAIWGRLSASRTHDGHKSISDNNSDACSCFYLFTSSRRSPTLNKTRNYVRGVVLCSVDDGPSPSLLLSLIAALLFIVRLQLSSLTQNSRQCGIQFYELTDPITARNMRFIGCSLDRCCVFIKTMSSIEFIHRL